MRYQHSREESAEILRLAQTASRVLAEASQLQTVRPSSAACTSSSHGSARSSIRSCSAWSARRPSRCAAEILLEHHAGEEMAARLGGDEFAMLLPGKSLTAAAALAEQIRATATRPDGMQYVGAVTLSIGVAVGEPGDTLASQLVSRTASP